ncbi:DUF4276 family protein [Methylophilus methylotrophus]|uniref:DUF4276 family protein n=1 Tax=Methylophilus methylotrophus TaxID=17 RepID=UPI000F5B4770|nr:DUF4276 family protein [Methylophilus methylotrophus]
MPTEDQMLRLGLIVEGDGEYQAFPSIISRIIGAPVGKLPRVNANGYGNITCRNRLQKLLSSLLSLDCVQKVIICVDAMEPIKDEIVRNCVELKQLIESHVQDWFSQAINDSRIKHIPEVVVVIQVQKLETWMIADTQSLFHNSLIKSDVRLTNVDEIPNPSATLKQIAKIEIDTKNPKVAKEILGFLDVNVMRLHSRSFDKFFREIS